MGTVYEKAHPIFSVPKLKFQDTGASDPYLLNPDTDQDLHNFTKDHEGLPNSKISSQPFKEHSRFSRTKKQKQVNFLFYIMYCILTVSHS